MAASTDKDLPVLDIQNLVFGYDKPLLNISHLTVAEREMMAVLGPSGCGKTTFMHLIAGLLRPQSGSIRINGTEITGLSEAAADRLRGQTMGIVFQRLHLIPSISVMNNLLLAQRLARTGIDRAYAEQLLDQLGISHLADQRPTRISQGQAQRVAIARAVAHRPSLLIADEPTSALDDRNASDALMVLRELTESSGTALIIVTHDERVRDRTDRIFELEGAS